MNKKYTESDIQYWAELYKEGYTLQQISNLTNIPKSSIRKKLVPLNILRPAQKKGRIPWNKGKQTGQVPWNKGMSKSGDYPYPSPNKGKPSPSKGIPRSQRDKDKISERLRELDYNGYGYGYYEKDPNREDMLYLIYLTFYLRPADESKKILKIGRTFNNLSDRYPNQDIEIIKVWYDKHKVIYTLEQLFLKEFEKFKEFGPNGFLGRTECFNSLDSPVDKMIEFIDFNLSHI